MNLKMLLDAKEWEKGVNKMLKKHKINLSEFTVLSVVKSYDGLVLSQSKISLESGLSAVVVSVCIKSLNAKGLVKVRKNYDDIRCKDISLYAEGRRTLERASLCVGVRWEK